MYGFAEEYPKNHYDTVDMPMSYVLQAAQAVQSSDEQSQLLEKWTFLSNIEVIDEEGNFILGSEGVLTDEEMYETIKVLVMDKAKFCDHKEKEGWNSDDEVPDQKPICDLSSYDSIRKAPTQWKEILCKSVELCLKRYSSTLEDDENVLSSIKINNLSSRSKYALHTSYGQK